MMIQCQRCKLLVPDRVVLPFLCGCGHRHCNQIELVQVDIEKRPTLIQKAIKATTAYTKWIAAGRPMREPSEIARLFAVCEACPAYDDGRCGQCGCGIGRERNVANKIALATEACPLGKW